jgi:hypothetical protein
MNANNVATQVTSQTGTSRSAAKLLLFRGSYQRSLFLLFLLSLPLVNPIVHGDGVGYYAYARAPLIEHTFDFRHDYQAANESFRENRLDANGEPKPEFRTRTGHLDNHFTVGPAILWFPFLLLAHGAVLLARAFGSSVRADGFSAPYRYAMAFGTALYSFLGLFLSFKLACKYVGPTWALLATVGIWWASPLPVYMYFNPSWSHAHSAFMAALFLWYWDATRERRDLRQWVLLGLITGLMLDVYYANLMIVAVLLVEALPQYAHILQSGRQASPSFTQLLGKHLLFVVVVFLAMIPTFASRWIVYGGPFDTGYVSLQDFLWRDPVFFSVLFSANHGLLAWTPILSLSIIGLVLFAIRLPRVGLPILAAGLAFYLFISFYPDWAGISSFGNRFFLSLTPLFVLGLAFLLERFASLSARPRIALSFASTALACFVLWNLGLIYQWGTHLVPARGPISFRQATYNQFHVVPTQLTAHLRAYFLRRTEMMRQIEKRDIEQMDNDAQP